MNSILTRKGVSLVERGLLGLLQKKRNRKERFAFEKRLKFVFTLPVSVSS